MRGALLALSVMAAVAEAHRQLVVEAAAPAAQLRGKAALQPSQ